MPIYEAECRPCGVPAEYLRSIEERHNTPSCPECGEQMQQRIFTPPLGYVRGRFEPFVSTIDGTLIKNHRDMDEHNRRNNVQCMADGYSNEKVLSGDFGIKKEKQDNTKDIAEDLMESAIKVRDGYKPEVQYED